jgi:hypothetical protein
MDTNMDTNPPRYSTFWQRQLVLHKDELRCTMYDPAIRALYAHLTLLVARYNGVEVEMVEPELTTSLAYIKDVMEGDADNPDCVMLLLLAMINRRVPALVHSCGPFLEQYLWAGIVATLSGEMPHLSPRKIWRFLPDNPITITPDGHPQAPDWGTVSLKHFSQF